MLNKLHVKTGDTVQVISGTEKGKQGKVVAVSPKEGKVIIEGVNKVSKHVKPRQMGQEGGIVKTEGAMYASKVHARVPQVQQSRSRWQQSHGRRQQSPRLQKMRRNALIRRDGHGNFERFL